MLVAVKRHDERKCQWCCWSVWRRCNAITWWMNISPKLNSPPCPWSPPPAPEWSAAPCGLAWELSSMSLRRGLCDPDIFSWGVGWSERWDWCRGVDDGRPMVQCDGCDEWFHSLCMGLCKSSSSSSSSSSTSQSKSSKNTLQSIKQEGTAIEPLSASSSTVILDNDTVSRLSLGGVQNTAVKRESKRKGKIKVKQEKKTLEEINKKVNCMFYCIACSEEREEEYPFSWMSDDSWPLYAPYHNMALNRAANYLVDILLCIHLQ